MIKEVQIFQKNLQILNQENQTDPNKQITVIFRDEFGNLESGIDENGLYKEFMVELSTEIFNPKYGFFEITQGEKKLHLNPRSTFLVTENHDQVFESLGMILARCIKDNVFMNVRFTKLFLRYHFIL